MHCLGVCVCNFAWIWEYVRTKAEWQPSMNVFEKKNAMNSLN